MINKENVAIYVTGPVDFFLLPLTTLCLCLEIRAVTYAK